MILTKDDIVIYGIDVTDVCTCDDYNESVKDWTDKGQFAVVDTRIGLTQSGKEKMSREFEEQHGLYYFPLNPAAIGGLHVTWNINTDNTIEPDTDGFIAFCDGDGRWFDADEHTLDAVIEGFYEYAAAKAAENNIRSIDGGRTELAEILMDEVEMVKGIHMADDRHPAYMRFSFDSYEDLKQQLEAEADKINNPETLKKLFPDIDELTDENPWNSTGLFQKTRDAFHNPVTIEFGLCYEGDDWEEKCIDGPYTLQAFYGDDVILCRTADYGLDKDLQVEFLQEGEKL